MITKQEAIHLYLFDDAPNSPLVDNDHKLWNEILSVAEPLLAQASLSMPHEWWDMNFGYEPEDIPTTADEVMSDAILALEAHTLSQL